VGQIDSPQERTPQRVLAFRIEKRGKVVYATDT